MFKRSHCPIHTSDINALGVLWLFGLVGLKFDRLKFKACGWFGVPTFTFYCSDCDQQSDPPASAPGPSSETRSFTSSLALCRFGGTWVALQLISLTV